MAQDSSNKIPLLEVTDLKTHFFVYDGVVRAVRPRK